MLCKHVNVERIQLWYTQAQDDHHKRREMHRIANASSIFPTKV